MNFITTEILDLNQVQFKDMDASKILLMDDIVNHFLPLFREDIEAKKKVLIEYKTDFEKLRKEILKTRSELVLLDSENKRQLLIKEVLEEITTLYSHEVLYGNNKKIALDILDSVQSMNLSTLQAKLKGLQSLAYKNVKKIIT